MNSPPDGGCPPNSRQVALHLLQRRVLRKVRWVVQQLAVTGFFPLVTLYPKRAILEGKSETFAWINSIVLNFSGFEPYFATRRCWTESNRKHVVRIMNTFFDTCTTMSPTKLHVVWSHAVNFTPHLVLAILAALAQISKMSYDVPCCRNRPVTFIVFLRWLVHIEKHKIQ